MSRGRKRPVFHFAGGGTGGHLFPALALAEALKQEMPSAEIVFWGTDRGLENKIIPQKTYRLEKIPVRGFQRGRLAANLDFPWALLSSLLKVFRVLLFRRPRAVVGTGGYVSGPVAFVAWLLWIPVFIQEQNSFPGVTTRLLARIARRVYLTFEASQKYFKNQKKLVLAGNPVRGDLFRTTRAEALRKFELSSEKHTLFIFGGSQGARKINRLVSEILPDLLSNFPLQVIWGTGAADFAELKAKWENRENVRIFAFIDDMPAAYAAADLVLCRAGATTLAEITAVGLPSILIPYPFSAAGHQEFNARALEKAGAARCLLEEELTPDRLKEEISVLLQDAEKLGEMARAARSLARPEAARTIVKDILRNLNLDGNSKRATRAA